MINFKPRWETIAVYSIPAILSFLFALMYIVMQMNGIYGGDAGDLTTAAYYWGIPHPPGYPLYTFLSGLIIRLLPFGTVAWKACFMSSIPSALSLFFLWRLCYRLTKSSVISTLSSILFGLSGPVWLNSITQEVFGLFSLINIVFLERALVWFDEKKIKQLYFLAFWVGISLTHQHVIFVTYLGMLLFILWRRRDLLILMRNHYRKVVLFVLLGFLPYVYAPITSSLGTVFDMEHAASIEGFIRLVSRASYGTFQATAGGAPLLLNRVLNVYTFFQFIVRDFTLPGVIFIFIGLFSMRKYQENLYDFITVSLFSWIFFFFFAGFSQLLNYHIGTSERFFIVPYQLMIICFAYGMNSFYVRKKYSMLIFIIGICLLIGFLFPQWNRTYQAYRLLRTDKSMEQLAIDVMRSAPENSMIFLFEDTTTYAMYYSYFVQRLRPDIKFIFFRWLGNKHYRSFLRMKYPDIVVPEPINADYAILLASFVNTNIGKFPLVSDVESNLLSGTWMLNGLLFVYSAKVESNLERTNILQTTTNLWNQFSPPLFLLSYYKEIPMISDVLRVYGQHRSILVRELALSDASFEIIEHELVKALALELNTVPEAYLYPVQILYERNRCNDAKKLLSLFVKKWSYDRSILRQYYKWKLACGNDSDIDPLAKFYEEKFPKDVQGM